MKKYSRENVKAIKSFIEEYHIKDEELNKEFEISEISLIELRKIFNPQINDDELFNSYELDEEKSFLLNKNLSKPILFDFANYTYFLQRYGEY
ncbi:MAG: hypothetical protein H6Q69_4830 [Firmicutes bacterium]|nr:hypothetical protein [Bacillota bacterium]